MTLDYPYFIGTSAAQWLNVKIDHYNDCLEKIKYYIGTDRPKISNHVLNDVPYILKETFGLVEIGTEYLIPKFNLDEIERDILVVEYHIYESRKVGKKSCFCPCLRDEMLKDIFLNLGFTFNDGGRLCWNE